jgi:hypothetical protein
MQGTCDRAEARAAGADICYIGGMLYLAFKALISGCLVPAVSEVAKRYPGFGGLIASLPLISVLGMLWLWRDTHDAPNMINHVTGTFWFVLPSLPMFLLIAALMKRGVGFYPALAAGCVLTMALYGGMVVVGPRLGLKL